MKIHNHLIGILTLLTLFCSGSAGIFSEHELENSFGLKEIDSKPIPVKQEQPRLSPELKGKQGKVYVAFIVAESGKVQSVRCVKSDVPDLSDPVLDSVRNWTFKPGKQNGTPVPVRVVVPIRVDFT